MITGYGIGHSPLIIGASITQARLETMKKSLLPLIHCIFCKSELSLTAIQVMDGEEIIDADLSCTSCSAIFPVIRGVPRLVSQQTSQKTDLHTGEKFAVSWKKFSRLDSRYYKQFYDWLYPVMPSDIAGKVVLEGGCGKGRHTQIVAESGAAQVIAVDIGDVVDIAFANVGHMDNVHIVQCDINVLPFGRIFDFGFSVGVLHHMQHPQSGFDSITSLIKLGGSVCVWVYGRENNGWIVNFVTPLRQSITSKVPEHVLSPIAWLLTLPLFLLSKYFLRPYDMIQTKLSWLPELFYQKYLSYIGKFDFNEIESIVFDHLIAPVAYYISKAELERWFNKSHFSSFKIRWHNKNSWTACANVTASRTKKELELVR